MKKGPDYESFMSWLILFFIFIIFSLYSFVNRKLWNKNIKIVILLSILLVVKIIYGKSFNISISFFINCFKLLLFKSNKTFVNISKKIFTTTTVFKENFNKIDLNTPSIWICNYPLDNVIEYFSQGLLPQKYKLIVNSKAKFFITKAYPKNRLIYVNIKEKNNYETLKFLIKKSIEEGYNVFGYFDTQKVDKKCKFDLMGTRTGLFNIAKELEVKITPIVMDHLYITNGMIPKQNFQIDVCDSVYIKNDKDIENIVSMYKTKLNKMLTSKFNNI